METLALRFSASETFYIIGNKLYFKEVTDMITLLVLFCVFLVIAFIVCIITGLIAISPILLVILALPLLDWFVIKLIRGKKKKD